MPERTGSPSAAHGTTARRPPWAPAPPRSRATNGSPSIPAEARGPIFIVGCPRSGTTLVQAILDAHPDVAIAPETHFARRFFARRDPAAAPPDPEAFLSEVVASDGFADTGLDPAAFRARLAGTDRSPAAVFLELLRAYGEREGARVIGEKTPNHLLHVRTLERLYPGSRFVHVIRDPRGVALSMRSVPWSKGSLERDTETWRRYMVAARRAPPRDPTKLHAIRYEALTEQPELHVRRLCAFIGVDFRPELLDPSRRGTTGVDLAREPWKERIRRPIDRGQADRWRETLSAGEVRAVEAVALGEMRRLGYRPATPAWRLVPVAAFTALRREVRLRRTGAAA